MSCKHSIIVSVTLIFLLAAVSVDGARKNSTKSSRKITAGTTSAIEATPLSSRICDQSEVLITDSNEELTRKLSAFSSSAPGVVGKMVLCQPGTFIMGSPKQEKGRAASETQHEVTITRPFLIGKCEVTQDQYERVLGSAKNRSHFRGAQLPVEQVSWLDANEFCHRLNLYFRDKLPRGYEFGLPTEAQWEYACRAGTTTPYSGSDIDSIAWYNLNSGKGRRSNSRSGSTQSVGQKAPNPWGLSDMHGNVWEWCYDAHDIYHETPEKDPVGIGNANQRIFRGGSWEHPAVHLRSACRRWELPTHRTMRLGFRLAVRPIISPKTGTFLSVERSKENFADSEEAQKIYEKGTLTLELGLEGHIRFFLKNGALIPGRGYDFCGLGTHPDLKENFPQVYFGRQGCLVNGRPWLLPRPCRIPDDPLEITRVEVLKSNRFLRVNDRSGTSLLLFDKNSLFIDDGDPGVGFYKIKIYFDNRSGTDAPTEK